MSSQNTSGGYVDLAAIILIGIVGTLLLARQHQAARLVQPSPEEVRRAEHNLDVSLGVHAVSPFSLPWRRWRDILFRTFSEFKEDRVMALAAGVVFYSLLAIFPAVTAGVSIYGLFSDAGTVAHHLSLANNIIPAEALTIIGDQISRIVSHGTSSLTLGLVAGLAFAMWSANSGIKAMFDALNVIYDVEEGRNFLKLNFISLTFTFCSIIFSQLLVGGVIVTPLVLAKFGISTGVEAAAVYGRWILLFAVALLFFSMIYRVGPSRNPMPWRLTIIGSGFAALAWIVMSALFSYYLANFANYDATYGSLGAAMGMMMWMWLSITIIFLGAELNSEIERQVGVTEHGCGTEK